MNEDKISSQIRWNLQGGKRNAATPKDIRLWAYDIISSMGSTDIPKACKAEEARTLTHFQLPPTKNCRAESNGAQALEKGIKKGARQMYRQTASAGERTLPDPAMATTRCARRREHPRRTCFWAGVARAKAAARRTPARRESWEEARDDGAAILALFSPWGWWARASERWREPLGSMPPTRLCRCNDARGPSCLVAHGASPSLSGTDLMYWFVAWAHKSPYGGLLNPRRRIWIPPYRPIDWTLSLGPC
jgi:hypothetical protein